jgi:uncharacterized protein YcbX
VRTDAQCHTGGVPHVVALFRYPVKGFTPEARTELIVQDDGRIAGDRVLAFRFADAALPEERGGMDYWPKAKGLALQDFPSLARLRLAFDDDARRVSVRLGSTLLVEAGLDAAGRRALVDAATAYVLASPDAARLRRPGRLPLEIVGDGVASRFQDRLRGFVSVHTRASVDALDGALEAPIDDRRFRSNVVVAGLEPWAELEWTGSVRIGAVEFEPQGEIVRCLATHANPESGERDAPILTTLTRRFGQQQPTLGRLLLPSGAGGVIRVGDEVHVAQWARTGGVFA